VQWPHPVCWTPFDGVTVTGWPVGTILRGDVVMWDGRLNGAGRGEPLKYL